jgi:hypothetical protein
MVAVMPFPATCQAMQEAGYRRTSYSRCKGCLAPIEWWTTPDHKNLPMEPMPQPESEAISHWTRCPHAEEFRRPPCKTDHSPQPTLLFESPQPTVKHAEKKGGNES